MKALGGTNTLGERRITRWLAVFASMILVLCAALTNMSFDRAAAAESSTVPVVFIIDASGSMVRETSPGVTRMDVAKKATVDTLSSLPKDARVGMLVFGTGTSNDDSQRAAGCADVVTLAPLASLKLAQLTSKVQAIAPSGFTPIGPALRQAVSMLPAGQPGNIVLVSDGIDTCAPPSSCQVASELHRDNPLISIHVVAFGVDDDEAAQQQMGCIGGVGGGTTVTATNPAQLASGLRAASDGIASSRLSARGYGGVQLGMSLDEVRASIDGAAVGDPQTIDGVVTILVDCGWGTVELRDNRVYSITPKDSGTRTAEGIGPDSSLTDVELLYGAPVESNTTSKGLTNVYSAGSGTVGYRVTFDPQSKKVRYVLLCRCVPFTGESGAQEWEITFDGVGPLTLGMSLDDARAAAPLRESGYSETTWFLSDSENGDWLTATFSDAGTLVKLAVRDPRDDGAMANGSGYPSVRGIRLGESAATVVNAFPGGSYRAYQITGFTDYLVSNRDGRLFTFEAWRSAADSNNPLEDGFGTESLRSITIEDATQTLSAATRDALYGS